MKVLQILWLVCLVLADPQRPSSAPPHIIVILADDLGWNDVGFHGSNQIPTPNIDALAYSGVILHNYYVNPICTPSRSALMTGYHPIHTGLQSGVLAGSAPYALPTEFRLMPEYLNDLGYESRMVGKWHLGSHRSVFTPTKRGFLSHFGYWTGHMDYYDHSAQEKYSPVVNRAFLRLQHDVIDASSPYGLSTDFRLLPQYLGESRGYDSHLIGKWHLGHCAHPYLPTSRGFGSHFGFWSGKLDYYDHSNWNQDGWGFDFRRDMDVAWSTMGQYSTDLFSQEAVRVIERHAKKCSSRPLFLYLAHQAVHSANSYSPLQAPPDVVDKFADISDPGRRKFAAMLYKLDESVGHVVTALKDHGLLNNSVIIFSTDNGGPAAGFNLNHASNWPLRGVKDTLWEGGVRAAGFVWSPLLKSSSRISNQLISIEDWLPTLFTAAGGRHSDLPPMDGLDAWSTLSEDRPSPRSLLLHNIDDLRDIAAVRVGDWKFLRGGTYDAKWDGWFGPSGRDEKPYDLDAVLESAVAKALAMIGRPLPSPDIITRLRSGTELSCSASKVKEPCDLRHQVCLFNVTSDPCELNNVAFQYPDVVRMMDRTLDVFRQSARPPANKPIDPRGDPKLNGYTWTNWMDHVDPMHPSA